MSVLRLIIIAVSLFCVSAVFAVDTTPYKSASENGIKTCLSRIKEVSDFVIKTNPHVSHDLWSSNNTDSRMFSSFVVRDFSDGDSHVSIIVGPDKSGKCFAEYRETNFWIKSCSVVREEVFPKLKYSGSMNDTTITLKINSDGGLNVYLTPQNNGNSCLSTKRETIYF